MNRIAEEIKSYFGIATDPSIEHYGTKYHSGRYPWGSGDNPYQHAGDFYTAMRNLEKEGFTFTDESGKTYSGRTAIAKSLGLSTTDFRTAMMTARAEYRSEQTAKAKKLRDEGWSLDAIAAEMGLPGDSSVRALLNANVDARTKELRATADFLKQQIDNKGMIDVGAGVEKELGISREKLDAALYMLNAEGYPVYNSSIMQVTNKNQKTNMKIACPPGAEYSDAYNIEDINTISEYRSSNDGYSFHPSFVYPKSMDGKRLAIRYAEDGGINKDGVLEIRRGVEDLSLGDSNYAQVRILVDDGYYIKGMAVYSDNVPDGYDCIFNTNKTSDKSKHEVLKKIKRDADGNPEENPFGSLIKEGGQRWYIDEDGNEQLSLINKKSDEGDWGDWSKSLSYQFLGKQPMKLIDQQLKTSEMAIKDEYEEISSLTNPTLRKYLLNEFASKCDSTAEDLKAAALPKQKYQVLLPLESIKDNEVYAPNFENGETVALVRFPHGGTFEIPVLKVNNKNKEGNDIITKNAADAVGINKHVADRLSGADFDGDTVLVIPCNSDKTNVKIKSTAQLRGLEGFDPKMEYAEKPGMKYMSKGYQQTQMGIVSNLIMDMTLKGASEDELAHAVRHSMVVIDAEKHKLDYSQSEKDNNIKGLQKKYQGHYDLDGNYKEGGASTLLTRAGSEIKVPKTKGQPIIDKNTGELIYKPANETYIDSKGKTVLRTKDSTQMAQVKDAHRLSSGTEQEERYAEYANYNKTMANEARKQAINTKGTTYSAAANKEYKAEAESIKAKVNTALTNAPKERAAQRAATIVVKAKKEANPNMTDGEESKLRTQALNSAREKVGAKRYKITFTDNEWTAIQKGAVSSNLFEKALTYCDTDALRQRAMPRDTGGISKTKQSRIKTLAASGYTNAEIAKAVGVSTATVSEYIK